MSLNELPLEGNFADPDSGCRRAIEANFDTTVIVVDKEVGYCLGILDYFDEFNYRIITFGDEGARPGEEGEKAVEMVLPYSGLKRLYCWNNRF